MQKEYSTKITFDTAGLDVEIPEFERLVSTTAVHSDDNDADVIDSVHRNVQLNTLPCFCVAGHRDLDTQQPALVHRRIYGTSLTAVPVGWLIKQEGATDQPRMLTVGRFSYITSLTN